MQTKNRKKKTCRGNVQSKSISRKIPDKNKKLSNGEHQISTSGYKREIVEISDGENGKISRTVHQKRNNLTTSVWVVRNTNNSTLIKPGENKNGNNRKFVERKRRA